VPEEEARKRSPQLSHQLLSARLIQAIPPSLPSLPAQEPRELPLVELEPKPEPEPQALDLNDPKPEQSDA
jgi:hypothetical protein